VYPCGSRGNAEQALGIRIRETFETQGSVLGNFVLKVHGLLNTKTGEHPAGTCRSCPDATPRHSAGLGTSAPTIWHAVPLMLLCSGCRCFRLQRQPAEILSRYRQGTQRLGSPSKAQAGAHHQLQQVRCQNPHVDAAANTSTVSCHGSCHVHDCHACLALIRSQHCLHVSVLCAPKRLCANVPSRDDDIWVGLLARKHVQLPSADAWLKMVLSADLNTRTQQVLVSCDGICNRSLAMYLCSP